MKPSAPAALRLSDPDAERVRREHHDKIVEIQQKPAIGMAVIAGISLVDAVATPIAHGLGRVPIFVKASDPRGASATGRIEEIRDGSQNRQQVVVLKATGWGATIMIDVMVL
jgi:hypothetical protein